MNEASTGKISLKKSFAKPGSPPRLSRDRMRAWFENPIVAGLSLVAIVLASYAPAIKAGYIWDDDFYVTENATLRSLDGLRTVWFDLGAVPQYYPLVHSTYWIEQHLWGYDPRGYHVVNILLHATSVILLWRLLRRLRLPGAWFAASLFAVHPVEVESVAWITERKNVLSLSLAVASILSYLSFAPPEDDGSSATARSGRWLYYTGALVLFLAALLSKTVVSTLPAVLLVIYWWKRGRLSWRDVLPLLPFFVAGIALGRLTIWMETHHVGARGQEWSLTLGERVLLAGRALWFYAEKLAYPYPLIFFYPRWTIDEHQWWQYLFPLAAAGTIAALWLTREKVGRGTLAAVLIFAGVLVPALGFFDVYPFRYSFVADHFQYHASVALLTLAGAAGALVGTRLRRLWPGSEVLAAGALLVLLAIMTFRQTLVYRDLESLYTDTIAKNPTGWAAYTNLCRYYVLVGREDEGFAVARKALEIAPQVSEVRGNFGGILLARASRSGFPVAALAEAQSHLQKAVDLDGQNILARKGLGYAHLQSGHPFEAAAQFAAILELLPEDMDSLSGMAEAQMAASQWDEAAKYLERAAGIGTNVAETHMRLATVLVHLGRKKEAIRELEQVVKLAPLHAAAHFELGNLLMDDGQFAAAAQHYEQASRLRPGSVTEINSWGLSLLAMGSADQAALCFQGVLRIEPENADAQENLKRAMNARPPASAR